MAYNEILNPKTIKRFTFEVNKNGSKTITGTEEIEYNLIDWVDEKLLQWFTEAEITRAVKDLELCFYDLTKHNNSYVTVFKNWSEQNNFILPQTHAIHYEYLNKNKYVKINGVGKVNKYYDEYVVLIKNDTMSGDVLEQLLINKFPFLYQDMFWNTTEKSINVKDYVCTNNVLKNFPKELQHLTVSKIINYPFEKINYVERTFKFKIFSDLRTIYFNPYDNDKDKMSMYMPLDAFMNGDWRTITTNTEKSHTDYYKSFNSPTKFVLSDKLKELEDLIYNPIVLCLKQELLKQINSTNV